MVKKVYICPDFVLLDVVINQTYLTAMSETVSGYNLQGDDAEYAKDRSDGCTTDDDDLW